MKANSEQGSYRCSWSQGVKVFVYQEEDIKIYSNIYRITNCIMSPNVNKMVIKKNVQHSLKSTKQREQYRIIYEAQTKTRKQEQNNMTYRRSKLGRSCRPMNKPQETGNTQRWSSSCSFLSNTNTLLFLTREWPEIFTTCIHADSNILSSDCWSPSKSTGVIMLLDLWQQTELRPGSLTGSRKTCWTIKPAICSYSLKPSPKSCNLSVNWLNNKMHRYSK